MAADDTRRWIAAAALVGFALRLAFGLVYWTHQPLTRDEREYLSLARSLAAGRGYVYDSEVLNGPIEPFGRAPGYPVFLALTGGAVGLLLAALTLFALDIPVALAAVRNPTARLGILKAIAKTLFLGGLFSIAYFVAAIGALRRRG